jgi:hypothetical protein
MEDFSLQGILESLEKQAGVEKQAGADPEKKEKTDEEKAKEEAECAGQAAGKAKKDIEEAEGKNGKEQTKEAATVGADLAKAVLEKVATLQLNQVKTEENMNKQAAEAGKALANALLEKLASVGDMNTENGISTGVPNKTQVDLAAQEAEQAAIIHVQPGTDGRGNGGTVNQIFDAIVAKAMAGAAPAQQNPAPGTAKDEGALVTQQAPHQVQTGAFTVPGQEKMASDEHEKAAAVSQLVAEGIDFDSAVNMVKEAAEEIEREEVSQVKQAALAHLIDNGMDFDQAVNLVKRLG